MRVLLILVVYSILSPFMLAGFVVRAVGEAFVYGSNGFDSMIKRLSKGE